MIAVLVLATALGAQLKVTSFTKSNLGVFATSSRTSIVLYDPGRQIYGFTSVSARTPGAHASSYIEPYAPGQGLRVREFGAVARGAGTSARAGTTSQRVVSGRTLSPHSLEILVEGSATSNLVLSVSGIRSGPSRAVASVDVDANNRIDFTHTIDGTAKRLVIAGFKGGHPRRVIVTTEAWAMPGGSYDFTFAASLEAPLSGRCHYSPYGDCGALYLDGTDRPTPANAREIRFLGYNGYRSAPCVLVIGTAPASIPILPVICPLYTTPLFALSGMTTDRGSAVFKVVVSRALKFQDVRAQLGVLRTATSFALSNGLRVDCF